VILPRLLSQEKLLTCLWCQYLEEFMSNFQTIRNSLKKLENQQDKTEKKHLCGVIYIEDYKKLIFHDEHSGGNRRSTGYLLVPRRLTVEEWVSKYGATEKHFGPD
jgi:hypothetical protein